MAGSAVDCNFVMNLDDLSISNIKEKQASVLKILDELNYYKYQRLECAAPKRWSKYTTCNSSHRIRCPDQAVWVGVGTSRLKRGFMVYCLQQYKFDKQTTLPFEQKLTFET